MKNKNILLFAIGTTLGALALCKYGNKLLMKNKRNEDYKRDEMIKTDEEVSGESTLVTETEQKIKVDIAPEDTSLKMDE